jgi:hypothetical protein
MKRFGMLASKREPEAAVDAVSVERVRQARIDTRVLKQKPLPIRPQQVALAPVALLVFNEGVTAHC